jgi:putative DNA primase/helicase
MIAGPTPLHMIEKPAPGTGAGLMVDAISIIATGTSASVMVEGRDEEEWRKRLTAKLRTIPSLLLIDNLRRRLESSAVAAALTAPYWEDRVLGKSEMTRFPIRCVWIGTANNPEFSNEIARRMVRIRMDPHEDQPWLRKGFRRPNLLEWVWESRAHLVAACLTLGQGWIAAGMPRHGETIGSFEGWARVMGGILEVAGVPGFLGNLKDMYEAADAEGGVWRGFVTQWWDRFGSAEVGVTDLYELALGSELPLAKGDERAKRTRLGQTLKRMRDRVYTIGAARLRVAHAGVVQGAQRWRLEIKGASGRGSQGSQGSPRVREPLTPEGGGSHEVHAESSLRNQKVNEPREPYEPFSPPYACAHTRAHACDKDAGKGSRSSQGSPNPENPPSSGGEPPCEPPTRGSQRPGGWWEEVI